MVSRLRRTSLYSSWIALARLISASLISCLAGLICSAGAIFVPTFDLFNLSVEHGRPFVAETRRNQGVFELRQRSFQRVDGANRRRRLQSASVGEGFAEFALNALGNNGLIGFRLVEQVVGLTRLGHCQRSKTGQKQCRRESPHE